MSGRYTFNKKFAILIVPLLFVALPILSLLSQNDITPTYAIRPLVITTLATLGMMLVFWLVLRDLHLTAAATSFTLLLFFSYGHMYGGFLGAGTFAFFKYFGLVGNHLPLAILWLLLWLIGVLVIRRSNKLGRNFTALFAIIAVVSMIQPIYRVLRVEYLIRQPWPGNSLEETQSIHSDSMPDIYYIVLDGYARADILKEIYGYDNQDFLSFLAEKGFYVAKESRSNYGQTVLSLASSLNMSYLDVLVSQVGDESEDRLALARLIRHSQVRRILEEQGYLIINISSGFRPTEFEDADEYLAPSGLASTSLERLIIDTSILSLIQKLAVALGFQIRPAGYEAHRQRIDFALTVLPEIAAKPGPKFVFAHIIIPHPPFVFGPQGEMVDNEYPFNLMDGDAFASTGQAYHEGYIGQLTYLNTQLKVMISELRDSSPTPPIIILQADHGPGLGLVWGSPEESDLTERFSIFHAYYLPGDPPTELSPEISPVNSFRFVFNRYFGSDFPLLENLSSFSTLEKPYKFFPLVMVQGKLELAEEP